MRRPVSGGARWAAAVALGLAVGPAVALGFARFAYALLLPMMRDDLRWSYAFAGTMNTVNAAGYLAGALAAASIVRRLGARRTFTASILATALSLLGTGLTDAEAVLLLLRTVSGVGGATAFIAGAVLSARFASVVRGRASGLVLTSYYAGSGVGIAASGLLIPQLAMLGASWREGWIALGAASLLALLPAHRAAARVPEADGASGERRRWSVAVMAPALTAYFLFALGYIAYMTYSVAYLLTRGFGAGDVTRFWVLLGLAAVASPVVWSGPIARWPGGRALSALLAVVAAGAALPLVLRAEWAAYLSAALFGGSFLSVVATMSALVRRLIPSPGWDSGIAAFTVVFAAGQTLGPALAGAIADGPGGLVAGLGLSAGALLLGALVALLQSHRLPQHDLGAVEPLPQHSPQALDSRPVRDS